MTETDSSKPNIVSAPFGRHAVHDAITEDDIGRLVEAFYSRVRADDRLGPIFESRLEDRWDEHLSKMKLFWSSVLLKTGRYKGKPVPAHTRLSDVHSEDFRIWLRLFRRTADEIFAPEAAELIIGAAERIAQSLWLAMFASPFDAPPRWMRGEGDASDAISC